MKPLRWTVMLTQPLWIAAYAVMLYQLDVMNTAGIASTGYTVAHLALRFLAGLGVVVLAFILHFLATECEEDDAARRLNSVVWLLIPLSLLPQMLAGSIPWFAMAIQLIFVGAWVWIMWLFILGVVRLQRHAAWSLKDTVSEHGREERIAEKRAEFDREVEARIRAAPQTDDDPISY